MDSSNTEAIISVDTDFGPLSVTMTRDYDSHSHIVGLNEFFLTVATVGQYQPTDAPFIINGIEYSCLIEYRMNLSSGSVRHIRINRVHTSDSGYRSMGGGPTDAAAALIYPLLHGLIDEFCANEELRQMATTEAFDNFKNDLEYEWQRLQKKLTDLEKLRKDFESGRDLDS